MAISPPRPDPGPTRLATLDAAPKAPRGRGRRPDQLTGGRHGLSAEEVAASQRARLLRAMTAAVGEHGFRGTRVADVVWRAGVSRKTFYELFESKDDCFAAAYDHWSTWLLDDTLSAFDTQTGWVDRLRAALVVLLGDLAREPDAARLCFVEAITAGEEAARRRDHGMRRLAGLFLQAPGAPGGALGEAISTGRVSELSETLRREIVDGRTEQLPTSAPALMYAMVLPFLGPEAAQRELDRGQTS